MDILYTLIIFRIHICIYIYNYIYIHADIDQTKNINLNKTVEFPLTKYIHKINTCGTKNPAVVAVFKTPLDY